MNDKALEADASTLLSKTLDALKAVDLELEGVEQLHAMADRISSDPLLNGLTRALISLNEKREFLQREQEYALIQLDQMQRELESAYLSLLRDDGKLSASLQRQTARDGRATIPVGLERNSIRVAALVRKQSV